LGKVLPKFVEDGNHDKRFLPSLVRL